jgi:hypothetical protein
MCHKFLDVVVTLECTVFLLLHKVLYKRHSLINHLVLTFVKIKITVIYEIGLIFILGARIIRCEVWKLMAKLSLCIIWRHHKILIRLDKQICHINPGCALFPQFIKVVVFLRHNQRVHSFLLFRTTYECYLFLSFLIPPFVLRVEIKLCLEFFPENRINRIPKDASSVFAKIFNDRLARFISERSVGDANFLFCNRGLCDRQGHLEELFVQQLV